MADEINVMKEQVNDQEVRAPFDPTKKKKKKKAVVLQDLPQSTTEPQPADSMAAVIDRLESKLTELNKKKKPVEPISLKDESFDDNDKENNGDYHYEELLGRVFNTLRENNPELAGDRRRTVMRPPQVLREGTKKTVFVNFMDLCKTMHRQHEHVYDYLLAELATTGSIDGQQRMVVKGRFAPKNFEALLRQYMNEYVICLGCKGSATILSKENRIFFVRCEKCGSGRSVKPITRGFDALAKKA